MPTKTRAATVSSRRSFLKSCAALGGGLVICVHLPGSAFAKDAAPAGLANAWVRVAPDNTVTIICHRAEMGQGTYTSMPMLVAEELEVDLHHVKIEMAPADPVYINALLGGQLTGGSTSVRDAWDNLRRAGAQARIMLVAAGAKAWAVDPSTCHAENGNVVHASGKKMSYGQLAARAATLDVPKDPPLKAPSAFKIVGKGMPRLDTPAKVTGKAEYGIDVQRPGMLVASLAQCPVIGGKVKRVDSAKAAAMPGVRKVVQIDDGVAVVADTFWQAKRARDALAIEWDLGPHAGLSSESISKQLHAAVAGPAANFKRVGDADQAMAGAVKKIEATYELPFLAHATMEPMNFTADVRADGCDVYGPTQFPQLAEGVTMAVTGLPKEKVKVHTTFLGGGFGRRIDVDFIVQAVQISKAVGKPVKLVWTREDDMTHDFYRPVSVNTVSAGVDANGMPVAWKYRLTSPSVTARLFPPVVKNGVDPFMTEASFTGYDVPNQTIDVAIVDTGMRVGYWRSVSHALNAFAYESFMDELAAAANKDPVEYRRALLTRAPRHLRVLNLAAEKAGWGKAPAGRFHGVALMDGYDTYVAQVSEISIDKDGGVRVHKVACAVDCGMMVNPAIVRAQVESSVAFGLSAAIRSQITLGDGRVLQSNFHDYPVLRMNEMPHVDVILVPSTEKPGGMGEPVVATVGPSIANAVFAATGKRIRKLPILADDLKRA